MWVWYLINYLPDSWLVLYCVVKSVPTFFVDRIKLVAIPNVQFCLFECSTIWSATTAPNGSQTMTPLNHALRKKLSLGVRLVLPGPLTLHPPDETTLCVSRVFVFDYKIVSLVYRFEIDTALKRVNVFQTVFWCTFSRRCILFGRITLELSLWGGAVDGNT